MAEAELPAPAWMPDCILLARNFGSFAAISAGLAEASGDYFAVLAADLQDPPEIAEKFFAALSTGDVDVVVGTREVRADPWPARIAASVFWGLYRGSSSRRFHVEESISSAAIARFAITSSSSTKRTRRSSRCCSGWAFAARRSRMSGAQDRMARVAWTIRRKLKYLSDSVFAFSDLPVRLLFYTGLAGLLLSGLFGLLVTIGASDGRHRGTRICRDRTHDPVLRRAEHIRPGNRWRVCMARLREHEAASRLSRAVD